MEGYPGHPPPSLIPRFWAPGWNSVQALNKFQDEVGGPLTGGDPGERLIEPMPGKKVAYFQNVPAGFKPRAGEWLLLPLHHIFGSEELSALAPAIAELSPQPYLALNPDDASDLGLAAGDEVQLRLRQRTDAPADGLTGTEPVAIRRNLPAAGAVETRVAARYCRAPRRPARSGYSCGNRAAGMGQLKKVEKGKQVEE